MTLDVDGSVFEAQQAQIVKDRYVYFKQFFDNFYNVDKLAPERISDQAWQPRSTSRPAPRRTLPTRAWARG